jgi:hypothetical protein
MATDWNDFVKHKLIRYSLIILLSLLSITILFGLCTSKHINLFGLEFNGNSKDTSTKVVATTLKVDSSGSAVQNNNSPNSGKQAGRDYVEKQDNRKTVEAPKKNSPDLRNAKIEAPLQIGDGNSMSLPKPRVVTKAIIDEIISKAHNKSTIISIFSSINDTESRSFVQLIAKELNSKGYVNAYPQGVSMMVGGNKPSEKTNIKYDWLADELYITIPSNDVF